MKQKLGIIFLAAVILSGMTASFNQLNDTETVSTASAAVALLQPALPATPNDYVAYAVTNLPQHYRGGPVDQEDNTPNNNQITNAGATLGRVLFYDLQLSQNDTVSCASCHVQAEGFSDSRTLSVGFNGGTTPRHSMGLTNAKFYDNGRFFWDERAATLEDQVLQPIQDPVEMGMNLTTLETKLAATSYYPDLFTDAFGDSAVTSERISLALAQFVRSMVSYNSKFDQARVANDFAGMFTAEEERGRQLFTSRQLACSACHSTDAHVGDQARNNGLDVDTSGDEGVGNGRFKVNSLRNIEVTAPYMHDGRFATLEQVVDFYSENVQNHPNLDNRLRQPGPNGQPRRPNLPDDDKAAIVAFLKTLTDQTVLTSDMFADPFVTVVDPATLTEKVYIPLVIR